MPATQILVVEDERLVATALQDELEHFGYRVSGIASSADEAVEKAAATRPDLVLMDIHLQGQGDGIDAARSIHDRWGIPIVYLSAFSDPTSLARASQTEAFGYLLKPYEERELHTTIEMAIAKRRAERKLEEAERWLAAIHNGIHDAVIAIDRDHRVRIVNLASEALTGWSRDAAIGAAVEAVCRLLTPTERIAVDALAARAAAESRTLSLPEGTRLVSQAGRQTPVEGVVSPIYDRHGEFLGVVLTFRDISVRLELERLRRLNDERKQHAQKLDAVSRIAGGLSSELTGLLTGILGNTSLALTQLPEDSAGHELLTRVEISSQRAAELAQRLLMFSRFTGRSGGPLRTVELEHFLPECINEIGLRLAPASRIEFHSAKGLWPVAADALLLGQALLELVLNAEAAMPAGGEIAISAENQSIGVADLAKHTSGQLGDFVCLKVSDTGAGMSPAVLARVLEPFFAAGEPPAAGGLGMALVSCAVRQHQGWIECESKSGRGTTFSIYLPRSEPVTRPPSRRRAP